jgi:hypothetical protein
MTAAPDPRTPDAAIFCLGCGVPAGTAASNPVPSHCGHCPPWTCDDCGQPCSMADPCACWISLDGMALADIKALFAASDLSIDRRPS